MPESDLSLLTHAATEAGEIARRYWNAKPQVWEKPDHAGPVTEADLAVDAMLREALLAARPDYGWLSEETEDSDARLSNHHVFIVDPIDGTRAFINAKKTWAHSLAVVRDGRVQAGVVYLPLLDKLYTAEKGRGAWLNGAPIKASARSALTGASVLVGKLALADQHWPGGVPEIERHHRPSLAYRLCLVAEGRFDAMLTLRDSWEWDIAAGALIASEAGAVLTDRRAGDLVFNTPRALGPGVFAMAPQLAPQILAARQGIAQS